jgi:tungstate transport system substrate-binding protein
MNYMSTRMCAILTVLLLTPLIALGCGGGGEPLVVAVTSDLEGSGLPEAWAEDFQARTGREVELVYDFDLAVLDMAKHGECDVLITHIPPDEEELLRSGYAEGRQGVMYDEYILVGPPDDPAGIRGEEKMADAFKKIGEAQLPFIFRVDGTGTAEAHSYLGGASGLSETGSWLVKTPEGMEGALLLASQEGAYTMTDRSTFERLAGELDLEIMVEGDEDWPNPYSAMWVSAFVFPDTDVQGAQKFIDYLLSDSGRRFLSMGAWEPLPEQ